MRWLVTTCLVTTPRLHGDLAKSVQLLPLKSTAHKCRSLANQNHLLAPVCSYIIKPGSGDLGKTVEVVIVTGDLVEVIAGVNMTSRRLAGGICVFVT
ncbi:uncharacterized protein YALI1_D03437g [Yarrowia lipolytica]|uniref:Uncharacterized protein n=1 Tax=Yarrowia lipolytica TaxID=4952 RepID=A0A1D8NCZ6_YARLL|nr:hypothetical protein YALI1_D03437g [Yarrowia lipolytica]